MRFDVRILGAREFRDLGFLGWGLLCFRVQGSGFRVQGPGFRVQGSGCDGTLLCVSDGLMPVNVNETVSFG